MPLRMGQGAEVLVEIPLENSLKLNKYLNQILLFYNFLDIKFYFTLFFYQSTTTKLNKSLLFKVSRIFGLYFLSVLKYI